MTSKAEPIELIHWDSTDYFLLYTMIVKPSPLNYDTETLKDTFYNTRWHVRPSHWTMTLRLYNYPLLYTMTSRAEPIEIWHWDSTEYFLLYTMIVKAELIEL